MCDSIIGLQQFEVNKIKLKNKQKQSHNYEIIPIQYLNQDLILQTPKMNLPFGVTIFNEQHYLKLSFLNSENDPQICIFHDLILKIGTYFKNYISSNKKNSGYQFTNPISKYKSYPYLLSTKIFNNCQENLLIFDQYKNNLSLENIYKSDYCKSILYISNIWINNDSNRWGYDIYVLQLKIYTIYRHLSDYSFIEDHEDQRLIKQKTMALKESQSKVSWGENHNSDLIPIQSHIKYKKYFKMLSFGVPKENIRVQMTRDGLNSDMIDYQPDYLIPKGISNTAHKSGSSNLSIQELLNNKTKLKKTETVLSSKLKKKSKKSLFSLDDILKRIKNLKKTNIILV